MDGAMPSRAETARAYVEGLHAHWMAQTARERLSDRAPAGDFLLETRFRYNPNVESLVAMVPAVIAMLLLFIPAMLATLSIVREKELGSIVNFYVTPVSRLEFLLGKQLPYVGLAMLNLAMLTAFGIFVQGVPFTGSPLAFFAGGLLYVIAATALGLFISSFMNSQIAAIFLSTLITMLLAIQYSGMIDPVASMEGLAAVIGAVNPATHFVTISRGTFSKALGFEDLQSSFMALLAAGPVLLGLSIFFLKKQAR
jgi:ribosome-dependent ATPase